MNEIYLGDGAYACVDNSGYGFWIYTSDGRTRTNEIFLEPEIALNLIKFCMSNFQETIQKAVVLLGENGSTEAVDIRAKLSQLIK